VNATIKYTLGRIGLFLAVLLVLWPVPLNIFLKLMVAVLASAGFAFFLLRRWRDEMAQDLANAAQRRRAEKERLRAALAGEDTPGGVDAPSREAPDGPRDEAPADGGNADPKP
jgi:hypothetical protein